MILEEIIKEYLHHITFWIGIIGIFILLIGLIDALFIYIKNRREFQKTRYVIGKHIVLGLDFLVVKDILETVFIKGSDVHLMDVILLVVIVGIRMLLTSHTSKGIQEMKEQMEIAKLTRQKLEKEIENLTCEGEELEKKIKEFEERERAFLIREKKLEEKIKELEAFIEKK